MSRLGQWLLVVCCLFEFGLVSHVQAQTAQERGRARKLFLDAKKLVKQGRTPEAIVKLEKAYKLFPNPGILVTISYRYLDLGEPEESAATMSRIQDPDSQTAKLLKTLRVEIEKQLAQPVRTEIQANAPNATVSVDGQAARSLPAEIDLPRGKHRFTFRAPNRQEKTIEKVLRGSGIATVSARLDMPLGSWRVKIMPEDPLAAVRILLSGRSVTFRPEEALKSISDSREIEAGTYTLNCMRGQTGFATSQLVVESSKEAVGVCQFPDKGLSDLETGVAWGTAGLSVLSLATAIGLFASYESDLELYSDPPGRYDIDSNKQEFGGVLIGTAIAAGVVSALVFTGVIDM
jgi:hypothetical protein